MATSDAPTTLGEMSQTTGSESPNGRLERPNPESEKHAVQLEALQNEVDPDMTLWPWLRVLGAWLLYSISWGPALAFGAFDYYYVFTLLPDKSSSDIAWIGSLQTTILVVSGALSGPLFDRGYLKPMLALGCVLQILSFMMLSLATKYYQILLAQGIMFGLGCGLVFTPAVAFVSTSFTRLRAIAVGVTASGASIGGIVFPILFSRLQPSIGFPWTCRVIGFIQIGVSLAAFPLLYNAPVIKQKPRRLIDWPALKELPMWLFMLGGFSQFLAYWIPLFYVPPFATTVLGSSTDMAIYLIVILNAGSVFGRVLPALLIQKLGAPLVVSIGTACVAILLFAWIAVRAVSGFIVWLILFGFFSGLFVSGTPVMVTHPVISPNLGIVGTRMGMLWFACGIGALIGTPIAGALANPTTGDYLRAQIFAGCIMALGCIGMSGVYIASVRYDRKKLKELAE